MLPPLEKEGAGRYNEPTVQTETSVVLSGRVTLHRGVASSNSPCPAAFYVSAYTINNYSIKCKHFLPEKAKNSQPTPPEKMDMLPL